MFVLSLQRCHGNPTRFGEFNYCSTLLNDIVLMPLYSNSTTRVFLFLLNDIVLMPLYSNSTTRVFLFLYAPVRFQDLPFFDLQSVYRRARLCSGRNGEEKFVIAFARCRLTL
jgi:hypothetical protein